MIHKIFFVFTFNLFIAINLTEKTKDPNVVRGRSVIVHLFEWQWKDIANECEHYLGPNGFAAIQISPPNEHAVIKEPFRPWYERYQPVSYNLTSRSGTEKELINMVERCNAVNVRIYADAVINHMAGGRGIGSAGNHFNGVKRNFPSVAYSQVDFNDNKCKTSSGTIESYDDPSQVNKEVFKIYLNIIIIIII